VPFNLLTQINDVVQLKEEHGDGITKFYCSIRADVTWYKETMY